MKKRKYYQNIFLVLILGAFLIPGGCQRPKGGLTVVGSTSVQPFAEILAESYMGQRKTEQVFIQGGGSSAGIQAVRTGAARVGMSSRSLTEQEQDLLSFPIAFDAIALIVHPSNPITDLSAEQIRRIFSSQITKWNEIGGWNHPITLVTREEGSGTREAFQHMIMGKTDISLRALVQDSNGAIRQVVGDDPNSIGYISLGLVNEKVKALKIGGEEATIENIRRGRYKIVRPFLFVFKTEPEGTAKSFLDFVLSEKGQKLLVQEGLVGVESIAGAKDEVRPKGNV